MRLFLILSFFFALFLNGCFPMGPQNLSGYQVVNGQLVPINNASGVQPPADQQLTTTSPVVQASDSQFPASEKCYDQPKTPKKHVCYTTCEELFSTLQGRENCQKFKVAQIAAFKEVEGYISNADFSNSSFNLDHFKYFCSSFLQCFL